MLKNPRILNPFQTQRLRFEKRPDIGRIQSLDFKRLHDGDTPATVGWIDVTREIAPLPVRPMAKRTALDGSAVELVLRHRPQIPPLFQINRARDASLATAIRRDPARTANAVCQIPRRLIWRKKDAWSPGPVAAFKTGRFAENLSVSQRIRCQLLYHR